MRFPPLVLLALLCVPAAAQVTSAEQPIQQSMEWLRSNPNVGVALTGSEDYGTSQTTFNLLAYWTWNPMDPNVPAKLDLRYEKNGLPVARVVGDGTTIWAWDVQRREYSATPYGAYNGAAPEGHIDKMLQTLGVLAQGYSANAARLLKETFGGVEARYKTWLPGASVVPTEGSVEYSLGNPPRRSLEFLYQQDESHYWIDEIRYFDVRTIGSRVRTTRWAMKPMVVATLPEGVEYTFTPPANAKPIVGLRPVTGGG